MYNIVASQLINDLILNTDSSSQLILEEIKRAKSRVGNLQLLIEIDSDDDFAVDGTSSYSKSFDLGGRDIQEVYIEAINSIQFGNDSHTNTKLDYFLNYIMTPEFLAEVSSGHASGGGNQTIDVSLVESSPVLYIGSLTVDLTK